MKYLTKQWYWRSHTSELLDWKIDSRTREFSEKLYRELYEKAEKEWLEKWQTEENKLTEQMGSSQYLTHHPIMFHPIDEKKEYFAIQHQRQQKLLGGALSDELLNKVVDMRVLALGYSTQDFADEMMDFADQCHKESEWIFDEYKSFRWPEEKTEWIKRFFFPDNVIASAQKEGSNYRIVFKKSVYNDRVKEIIFCNANRLEEDAPLENAVWKHVEIYQIAGGYEIHILLVCGPCVPWEPLYLTLTCDDVQYIMAEE